jgi:PIN domain nuclease of toxin-antitoxin system
MILLDTHIVWWLSYDPGQIPDKDAIAIRKAEAAQQGLFVSAASLYELAWLLEKGRLIIPTSSANYLEEVSSRFIVLPVTGPIALQAAQLPAPFHGDPMDRMIVATALKFGHTLVTADRHILTAKLCKLVQ